MWSLKIVKLKILLLTLRVIPEQSQTPPGISFRTLLNLAATKKRMSQKLFIDEPHEIQIRRPSGKRRSGSVVLRARGLRS